MAADKGVRVSVESFLPPLGQSFDNESNTMSPIVLIGAGALILLVGVGLGYVLSGVKGQRDAAKADEVRQELDRYRQEVSEHFGKTGGVCARWDSPDFH